MLQNRARHRGRIQRLTWQQLQDLQHEASGQPEPPPNGSTDFSAGGLLQVGCLVTAAVAAVGRAGTWLGSDEWPDAFNGRPPGGGRLVNSPRENGLPQGPAGGLDEVAWHLLTPEQVLERWQCSLHQGLTGELVKQRRRRFGPNLLAPMQRRSRWGILWDQITGLPVVLLITWQGLVGIADPIRPGIPELIRVFHQAGIRTIMVTGDQQVTAHAIGPRAGTLAFTSLSTGQLLHLLSARSTTDTLFSPRALPLSPVLLGALAAGLGLQSLTLLVPGCAAC